MFRKFGSAVAIVLSLALVAAACGDDDTSEDTAGDTAAATTAAATGAVPDCLDTADLYALLGEESIGFDSWADANDLAAVLRAGALPAPVRILQERTVGPTMGEDARRQGTYALAMGLAIVIVFMIIYYRISGLVADLALLLNAVFIPFSS